MNSIADRYTVAGGRRGRVDKVPSPAPISHNSKELPLSTQKRVYRMDPLTDRDIKALSRLSGLNSESKVINAVVDLATGRPNPLAPTVKAALDRYNTLPEEIDHVPA